MIQYWLGAPRPGCLIVLTHIPTCHCAVVDLWKSTYKRLGRGLTKEVTGSYQGPRTCRNLPSPRNTRKIPNAALPSRLYLDFADTAKSTYTDLTWHLLGNYQRQITGSARANQLIFGLRPQHTAVRPVSTLARQMAASLVYGPLQPCTTVFLTYKIQEP